MRVRFATLFLMVAGILFVWSCEKSPSTRALTYIDEEVYIYDEQPPVESSMSTLTSRIASSKPAYGRAQVKDFDYRIFRVAQAAPVEVDGIQTQANDVVFSGDTLYVSYNTAGDTFAGALQVIDYSNAKYPTVSVEIGLPDADVNAVAVSGDAVYIAGAWDPDSATFSDFDPAENHRAFVARILKSEISRISADDIANRKVILSSFAATGIAIKSNKVFVSTGALNGEIEILTTDLKPVTRASLADKGDLRDIEAYHGGAIALQGTDHSGLTNGRILLLSPNGTERDTVTFADFGSPEAKATIEVYDNHYAFLGLSEAGFQIVFLKDESASGNPVESLYKVTNPIVEWSSRTHTNSVSFSGDLVFTANGGAGFRVFQVTSKLKRDIPPETGFVSLIGFVPFDKTGPDVEGNYWSANHVEFQARNDIADRVVGVLAVASGVGGLNLYYLTERTPSRSLAALTAWR